MANKVQRCYSEQRVVIQAGWAFGAVGRKPLAKINCGREKQTGRKQIPGTRENVRSARDWRCGRGEKGRAREIRRRGYHQERTGSLTAWLARGGNVSLDQERSELHDAQEGAADHPAPGDAGDGHV